METEEVLHGSKVKGLHVLSESLLPYSVFVRNGQSFLEDILLRLFMVPAEIPRPYSSSQGWRQSLLLGYNDPTLHLDLIHMLISVLKTIFDSVYTPPIAIRFGMSGQLSSSNLLFGHGGGGADEVVVEEVGHGK